MNTEESDPVQSESPTRVLGCPRATLVQHDEDVTRVFASDELRARAARVEQIRQAFAAQANEEVTNTAPLSSCFRELRREARAALPRDAPPCPRSGTRVRETAPLAPPVMAPLFEKRSCTLLSTEALGPMSLAHDTWPVPPPAHVVPVPVAVRAPLLLMPSEPIPAVQLEPAKKTAHRSSPLVATSTGTRKRGTSPVVAILFVVVAVGTFLVAHLGLVALSSLLASRALVRSLLAIGE